MGKLIVAGSIALLFAGMAYGLLPGQSEVAYTLELGGNNHVADWEAGSLITTAFTPGLAADSQTFGADGSMVITWDAVVAASGIVDEIWPYQGVTNIVFNLELVKVEVGRDVPVIGNRFFSDMNDGDATGYRRFIAGVSDPFEKAAFALGWDVDMNDDGALDGIFGPATGDPGNPGRLFDPPTAAGPGMDRVQFPSNTFHGGGRLKGSDTNYWRDCNGNNPSLALTDANGDTRLDDLDEIALGLAVDANANGIIDACESGTLPAANGVSLPGTAGEPLAENKLSGMGIGYSEFKLGSNELGVGLALGTQTASGWGIGNTKPAAEGQINMTGLAPGTYKLVLTAPANANNVMASQYMPTLAGAGGFALKADVVTPDEITFEWAPFVVTIPVTPTAWKSVRTHTGVGALGIALVATDGQASVEPRIGSGGQLQRIEVTFDGDLTTARYEAGKVVAPGLTVVDTVEGATNNILVLTISGSVDKACYSFDISACADLTVGSDATCSVAVLGGDVTSSATASPKTVSSGDVGATKNQVGKPLDATTAKYDVNCGGSIVNGDYSLVKTRVGNVLTCP